MLCRGLLPNVMVGLVLRVDVSIDVDVHGEDQTLQSRTLSIERTIETIYVDLQGLSPLVSEFLYSSSSQNVDSEPQRRMHDRLVKRSPSLVCIRHIGIARQARVALVRL